MGANRTSSLRIPQTHPLRLDVLVDEAGDGGTEGLLLVGSDPNEVPEERCRSRRQC